MWPFLSRPQAPMLRLMSSPFGAIVCRGVQPKHAGSTARKFVDLVADAPAASRGREACDLPAGSLTNKLVPLKPMRSILPESRRCCASPASYTANRMLDEPPLIDRTQAIEGSPIRRSPNGLMLRLPLPHRAPVGRPARSARGYLFPASGPAAPPGRTAERLSLPAESD